MKQRAIILSTLAAAALTLAAPASAQEIGDSTFDTQEFYQPPEQAPPEIPTCADGEVLSFKNGQMICTDYIRFSQQAVNAENAENAEIAARALAADRAANADTLQGMQPDDLGGDVVVGWVRAGFQLNNTLSPIEKCRSSYGSDVKRALRVAYTYFDPYKYHYHYLCIK